MRMIIMFRIKIGIRIKILIKNRIIREVRIRIWIRIIRKVRIRMMLILLIRWSAISEGSELVAKVNFADLMPHCAFVQHFHVHLFNKVFTDLAKLCFFNSLMCTDHHFHWFAPKLDLASTISAGDHRCDDKCTSYAYLHTRNLRPRNFTLESA